MLGLTNLRRNAPVLTGKRVVLRLPQFGDHAAWSALRQESRDFLVPWEPTWSPEEFGRGPWRQRLRRYEQDYRHGTGIAFFILQHDGTLVGGITLGGIRYGVSQSAHVGYWIGARFAGRGFMLDAINLVTAYGFERLGLHRIEAACIPDNHRSIRVLEKAGFSREGLLRSYLKINGNWRDHLLYALIAGDGKSASKG
jgi:ribosomal-protein-alanine N-acetyltransferase